MHVYLFYYTYILFFLDIANCRLFKPVNSSLSKDSPGRFLHLKFANKGIDAININNILHNNNVRKKQYHHISRINLTARFPILIHIPLHLNCSIIDNLYKTSTSLIMNMIVLLVLVLRRNSSTSQLDI